MDGQTFFQTLKQNNTNANALMPPIPIHFSGSDEINSFPIKGVEVNIVTSNGSHDVGLSKLKIKNMVMTND